MWQPGLLNVSSARPAKNHIWLPANWESPSGRAACGWSRTKQSDTEARCICLILQQAAPGPGQERTLPCRPLSAVGHLASDWRLFVPRHKSVQLTMSLNGTLSVAPPGPGE